MKYFIAMMFLFFASISYGAESTIQTGAEQFDLYLPLLKNKRVGVFANNSSYVGSQPLVDELLMHSIHVVKIFTPEHGLDNPPLMIPIVSMYGKKFKPTSEDLNDIDVLLFDIQDVGVRFYTYISSLQKLMEAAVDNDKPLVILDRPNPNGFYVDGPVLNPKFKSFTGMQSVPIVYGMTMGEYAKMLVGEEWLVVKPKSKAKDLKLTVIPNANYTHQSLYEPPIKPSPNLPDVQSIYWYPSIGLLEATVLSVGRGTSLPFHLFGHPLLPTKFSFMPQARQEAPSPPFKDQLCHGWQLSNDKITILKEIKGKLQIKYLMQAYRLFPKKDRFFPKSFNWAVGNDLLVKQIKSGKSEKEIRKSWEPELKKFKEIRKKYLLYPEVAVASEK